MYIYGMQTVKVWQIVTVFIQEQYKVVGMVTTLTVTKSGFPDLSLFSIVPVIGKSEFMLKIKTM